MTHDYREKTFLMNKILKQPDAVWRLWHGCQCFAKYIYFFSRHREFRKNFDTSVNH